MSMLISAMFFFLVLGITIAVCNIDFAGDVYPKDSCHSTFCWLHLMVNTFAVGMTFVVACIIIIELVQWGDDKNGPLKFLYVKPESGEAIKPLPFKKIICWIITVAVLLYLFSVIKSAITDCKNIYNKSKLYHNTYVQKVEEKIGFYDKLWKTYLQKEKITNVNKETFIQVTKIIMENRADGKKITWKWLQENQQIPYDEFTQFYADLSDFITGQREGYFSIEKECQTIANKNNTLLDTFPNNMYNKILKCDRIKFEYGFTSDSTDAVFSKGKENISR